LSHGQIEWRALIQELFTMATVDLYNLERQKVGSVELSDAVFDTEVREHLFHEVVRAQMAKRRSGTAKVKGRSEIHGTGAKAWRQKGTGRARTGSRKSPIWKGGGVAHGPAPRSFSIKVNKKTRKAALCAALSRRNQEGRLFVLEGFELQAPKTQDVAGVLSRFETESALIIDLDNENLSLSARNLTTSRFLDVEGLNVLDVLKHDVLMITQAAIERIGERLAS